ncbi:MAG: NAD(P)H-dependent oxidoreductase subunit E [Negativicutes bacterium]
MKKIKIELCQGTSCHLLGCRELVEVVNSLSAGRLEQIDLCMVDCLQSCRKGPNVRINGTIFSGMTPDGLLAMLEEHFCLTAS